MGVVEEGEANREGGESRELKDVGWKKSVRGVNKMGRERDENGGRQREEEKQPRSEEESSEGAGGRCERERGRRGKDKRARQ